MSRRYYSTKKLQKVFALRLLFVGFCCCWCKQPVEISRDFLGGPCGAVIGSEVVVLTSLLLSRISLRKTVRDCAMQGKKVSPVYDLYCSVVCMYLPLVLNMRVFLQLNSEKTLIMQVNIPEIKSVVCCFCLEVCLRLPWMLICGSVSACDMPVACIDFWRPLVAVNYP